MTAEDSQRRHLRYRRFGRNSSANQTSTEDPANGRRRGHWTGYRPLLQDAFTQARLTALTGRHDHDFTSN